MAAIIYLCDIPAGDTTGTNPAYFVLLQMGFALQIHCCIYACALTARFHPYQKGFTCFGGLFSVALSMSLRPPHLRPKPVLLPWFKAS